MPPLTLAQVALFVAVAAGLFLAGNLFLLLLARRHTAERAPDTIYRTAADDGWVLELARYSAPPRPEGAPRLPPVIVCHGLAVNSVSLDMTEAVSLPRFLRARGFDVWLLDLRGCGASSRPPQGRGRYDYSFDDHATRDVKAAIELVKRETGAPRVSWVGHSMGGAVCYGHCERYGDQDLQAVVGIASPSGFGKRLLVTRFSPFARWLLYPGLPHEWPARLVSSIAPLVYGRLPLVSILINARNAEDRHVRIALARGVANPSMRLIRQFARWSMTGELKSEDGSRTWFSELGKIRVPWLAIAGVADQLVPPENVREGWERLGSPDKEWLLVGAQHGHAADYGHCDLVIGSHCRKDVYEPIARFLEKHSLDEVTTRAAAESPATASSPLSS